MKGFALDSAMNPRASVARVQYLWLEGSWMSSNKALDVQRATGFYVGHGKATGRGRETGAYSYNTEVKSAEVRVWAAVRRQGIDTVPGDAQASLWIWLLKHCKYDPSAWTLASKWVEDALVRVGVLASDRRNVYAVGGRCCQSDAEGKSVLGWRGLAAYERKAGMLVEIAERL